MVETPDYSYTNKAIEDAKQTGGFSGEVGILRRLRKVFPAYTTPQSSEEYLHSRTKEVVDRSIGFLGLLVFSPIISAALVATKLSDPKEPVIYTSTRIGGNGKPFEMTKIRTMKSSDDQVTYAHLVDPNRITRLGKFLRSTSIDELLQFWDMARGRISAVGVRAVTQEIITNQILPNLAGKDGEENEKGEGWYQSYISAKKPGCTGLAQILGHNRLTERHRRHLDVFYVSHANLLLDLYILLATPAAVIRNIVTAYKNNPR